MFILKDIRKFVRKSRESMLRYAFQLAVSHITITEEHAFRHESTIIVDEKRPKRTPDDN